MQEKHCSEDIKEGSGCHFQEKLKKSLQGSSVRRDTVRWQKWRRYSVAAVMWKICRTETESCGFRQKMKQLQEKALHY